MFIFIKRPSASVRAEERNKKSRLDPERESRTVFVGNLPSSVKPNRVRTLFSAAGFKAECVRLRCAARPDAKTTKRLAVIKGNYHEGRYVSRDNQLNSD